MAQVNQPAAVKEYVVRVPKNSRKKYSMMRFHSASGVEFKNWTMAKMERENNYKEFKSADDDQPKFGAGSEFGREQRDEARRKRYGINIKKYKPDNQPWLLSVKDKTGTGLAAASVNISTTASVSAQDRKFKGIREGGVSDNVAWYVFLQAKDGAFEAYPVEEWYNFQPINRYKSLNAEEAELEFERRDKIVNYFSVMYQKKLRNEEEDVDPDDATGKKKGNASKALQLSEMDDWMSDKDSDDDGDGEGEDGEARPRKPKPKKGGKKTKKGGKRTKTDDGDSGDDCEEESDDFDEGAEHEYIDEDSSDPDHEDDEKVTKDLAGVEEGKALKKLLNSDDEDEDDDEEEDKKKIKEEKPDSDEEKKKKKKRDSSPDLSDSSDEDRPKPSKDGKKGSSNGSTERNSDILKRKMADHPDGLLPAGKKGRSDTPTQSSTVLPSDSGMFEDQIRRYLVRKPMTTTEILQKLKSKKTGHTSEQLVDVIAVMLKKINPHRHRVKGKMYLSLKTLSG